MLPRIKNIFILLLLLVIGVKDFVQIYTVLNAEEISFSSKKLEFRSPSTYNNITIPSLPDQIDNRESEEEEFGENEETILNENQLSLILQSEVKANNDINSSHFVLYPYKYLLYCSLKLDC